MNNISIADLYADLQDQITALKNLRYHTGSPVFDLLWLDLSKYLKDATELTPGEINPNTKRYFIDLLKRHCPRDIYDYVSLFYGEETVPPPSNVASPYTFDIFIGSDISEDGFDTYALSFVASLWTDYNLEDASDSEFRSPLDTSAFTQIFAVTHPELKISSEYCLHPDDAEAVSNLLKALDPDMPTYLNDPDQSVRRYICDYIFGLKPLCLDSPYCNDIAALFRLITGEISTKKIRTYLKDVLTNQTYSAVKTYEKIAAIIKGDLLIDQPAP